MRRMNSAQASTSPTCTATVRSNTTVRKKVPSISTPVVRAVVAQAARTRATRPCSRPRTAGCRPAPPAARAAPAARPASTTTASVSACTMPATGEVAPERMLVTVRAMVPVAGMPPKKGTTKLATPCAISSWLGSWRGRPLSWSATRAHSSDSMAPSSAMVRVGVTSSLTVSQENSGSAKAGRPCGMPPKRVPMVSTGRSKYQASSGQRDQRHDRRPACARRRCARVLHARQVHARTGCGERVAPQPRPDEQARARRPAPRRERVGVEAVQVAGASTCSCVKKSAGILAIDQAQPVLQLRQRRSAPRCRW